ncbi:MAG: uroporphyrinogen-III C-methyltransferase [Deltaproteobacteria bacterium]|nr:uroporphyrinogen-III C-methyltransferase [Deltaproteobacteria bacterium]
MKSKTKGSVYLVGAGPGDPELITVKGLKLIQKADVIIYDFLIDQQLLSFAKKDAELICVGKSPSHHTMKQEDINKLLVEKSNEYKMVVRLKNGDPFIFGRGGEEAIYLSEQDIPCEVVSGVSSAIAVPASAGIPLTHRDYASSVAIITGHRREDGEVKFVNADTLVFLMAVANLERIIKKLLEEGKGPETPCILITRGTFPDQKVVQGNLGNILHASKKEEVKPPAVLVVGEVVNLRDSLIRTTPDIHCKFEADFPSHGRGNGSTLSEKL